MYRGKYSNLIKEIIKESFIKDYSGTPIVYYTTSDTEAEQMISTLLVKNPVRGLYDLKNNMYIFGNAFNLIHADLIEKLKLYGKGFTHLPILEKEIYQYLDKYCAMFKIIDENDYKSFSSLDGYKYAYIGKLKNNQYIIFRNNELAPSYYNAPDELKKMQKVPLFKNIQFKKYDIRSIGLNSKDQLPQNLVNESKNLKNLNDNFWKWFDNSKVVDKDDNPLVVIHRTKSDFNTFDITKSHPMNLQGKGFYFSSKDDLFMKNSFGNKIMKCYLSIKNPFYGYGVKYNKSILQKYISEEDLQKIFEGNNSETFEGFELFFGLQMSRAERNVKGYDTIDTTAILKNLGFDGIYLSENNVWVAFEPNQIKSIDNNGEWNSNSNNIYETYDYIDDTEVLLNPTKKEFNDFVNKNKWYRILLSKTGFAIWSADTPLLHMYVEDEYDVKNATHLFAYNGNVYFQDYNLIPEDFDNDMKEWFIKQAKELDNNKILRTYFPRMNMEQSVIKMFNGENVIVEAKHRKKLNLPDNSENQVINKVINAIRNNRWDTGEIINNYILFTELAYSHYLDAIIDEMENNKIHLKNTYEKIYNQAINYIYKNMNNQNSLAFKITDDIYRNSAEHILQNIKNELIDNNIYREIDTKLSINELLQHLKEYGTGNCWAKQYDKAESYNSDYNGTSYIFVGQATDKNISWYDSILLRMVNEDENEIRLRNNAPIRITKIINKDTKKRYNVNQVFSTGDKYNYPISFNESKQNINENKLSEVQEDIKYILSSDTVLFSCDPSTYDFMLKCLKQGQKPEYFYFNFYKNRPTFMNLCRSLLYRFTGNKIKGTDELIKKKISSYDGYSISKEAIKVILNGYYGKIKVGI